MKRLPTEIVVHIFRCFCRHCVPESAASSGACCHEPPRSRLHRHALRSLCLVSRRFGAIAQPILHHEFVPTPGDWPGPVPWHVSIPDVPWSPMVDGWNRQFESFLRTVTERRDLAAAVRRVFVHAYVGLVLHGKRSSHPWTAVAFAAARLPNLEQYSLEFCGCGPLPVKASACPQDWHSWCMSSDCKQHSVNIPADTGPRPLQEELTLPALNIHTSNHIRKRCIFPPDTTPQLKVEALRVTQSRLAPEDLECLLTGCTGLRKFVFEAAFSPPVCTIPTGRWQRQQYGDYQFSPADAAKYLLIHEKTLETLHIDLRTQVYAARKPPLPVPSLGSFVELRSLFLDWSAVCSPRTDPLANQYRLVEMLPPNLVSLKLVGCFSSIIPLLADMLLVLADAIASGIFKGMEQVRCEFEHAAAPEHYARFDEYVVGERFASAGVDFGYEMSPLVEFPVAKYDGWPSPLDI